MQKKNAFEVISLPGVRSFQEVYALQQSLLEKRIRDEISDTLIFCEHFSIVTRGRGLQRIHGQNKQAKALLQLPLGTDYVETTRGGDLTWHGPGQLVLYPIIKLGGDGALGQNSGQDIHAYIRFLESIIIHALKNLGLNTLSLPEKGSGVWLETDQGLKKVASVGIAIRKWVSYHGIALNIVNELLPYQNFEPCGFDSNTMTRLVDQIKLPESLFLKDWREVWEKLLIEAII